MRLNRFAAALGFVGLFAASSFGDLFAVHIETGDLYSISTTDASATLIGNTGVISLGSLEFSPSGTLYAFTVGSNPILYEIDPTNAMTTLIGAKGIGFVFEGGLAFTPGGAAYGVNQDNAGNPILFTVDTNTGMATIIGTISGGSHDINGLAWRSDGMLVGLDRVTNSLLTIDPVTAVSAVIAVVSPTIGALGGMTVDGSTAYFNTAGPGGSIPGSNELYSFDLFTGAHQLIGSFAPTITGSGLSGLAARPGPTVVPAVSEWGMLVLTLIGLIVGTRLFGARFSDRVVTL